MSRRKASTRRDGLRADFEGTPEELEGLLIEGLASRELSEEEFWGSVEAQTNALLAGFKREGSSGS
jgi:hypothetical protein